MPLYSLLGAITALELLFCGIVFFVVGLIGLGYGKMKDGGPIFLLVGVVNGITALSLLYGSISLGLQGVVPDATAGIFITVAAFLLLFSLTFTTLGYVCIKEIDFKPFGNFCLLGGITMIPYAYFVYAVLGGIWLTVSVISWLWAFLCTTLVAYEKASFRILGWTFLIEAFYTLWVPASLLIVGIPLP